MSFDWSDPTIIGAVIAAIGAIVGGIIAAYAAYKARTRVHNEITLLDAQKGRKRTNIRGITGTNSNIGMNVTIENNNSFPVNILSEEGSVIDTRNPGMQKMIAARPQVFQVSPNTNEEFSLNALCMEAFKEPPSSSGEGNHKIKGVTRNKKIRDLFGAIKNIEDEISSKIVSTDGSSFQARPMNNDLEQLARVSIHNKGSMGQYESKVIDHVVQCALWQVTDNIDFQQFSEILNADSEESVNRLKEISKLAAIILKRAGVEPTIH